MDNNAVYMMSQVACALVEMEAMKAANEHRKMQGYSQAYGEEEFLNIIQKYGIHHNNVVTTLQGVY